MSVGCLAFRRVALPVMFLAAAPAVRAQAFYEMPTCPLVSSPRDLVVGDFDSDGIREVAIVPNYSGFIILTHGLGGGVLVNPVTVSLGGQASALAVGDFNLDGKLDLLVAAGASGPATTLFGNGNGTFTPAAQFPVSGVLWPCDVDGDRILDVVGAAGGGIKVLRGHGDAAGAFDVFGPYASNQSAVSYAVDDLDGDGCSDVMTTGPSTGPSSITVLRGQADGTLVQSAVITGGGKIITGGDLDGDGLQDLALVLTTDKVRVLHGQGDAVNFSFDGDFDFGGTAAGVAQMLTADFDGDGAADLVLADQGHDTLNVLAGGSTLSAATRYDVGADPQALRIADMDADGSLDLVCGCLASEAVTTLLGRGDGTFKDVPSYKGQGQGAGAASGDVNGDGIIDIVGDATNTLFVMQGAGDGSFAVVGGYGTMPYPQDIQLVDLDGDGKLDIVGHTVNSLCFLHGQGNTAFDPTVYSGALPNISGFVLRDFDGDGELDAAATDFTASSLRIERGNGAGVFTLLTTVPLADKPHSFIAAGDLDGNGVQDVLTDNDSTQTVTRVMGTGGGSFAAPISAFFSEAPEAMLLQDVVGDGALDLVLADDEAGAPHLRVFRGLGDGTFAFGTSVAVPNPVLRMSAADINGDGWPDIAFGAAGSAVDVVTVKPTGQLANAGSFWAGHDFTGGLTTDDFDGDGRADIGAMSSTNGNLSVLLHRDVPSGFWANLGHALAGVAGPPKLTGAGPLVEGSAGSLTLTAAKPSALALLFVSLAATPTPFKGGTLVAQPAVLVLPLATTGSGGLALNWSSWPAGLTATKLCFQYAIQDAAAVKGVALSEALQAHAP